jgi:osmotically-inducible protein OsmY
MTRTPFALALALAAALGAAGCAPLLVGTVAAGGVMVAVDRRQPDVMLQDERIEVQSGQRIGAKLKGDFHVNSTSFNRQLLLTGEVPNEAAKLDAEQAAAGVPDVRNVVNELRVAPASSLGARSNDAYVTSSVKARMVSANKFNPANVKVVTEAETVFLMGLVTRREADDATQIARTTSGVKRVVRVFEYMPDPAPKPAAAASKPAPEAPKQ